MMNYTGLAECLRYKEQVFSKFIFLGVHKSPPLENKTSKKSCKKSVNTINGSLKNRQV